ncbi:MAG: hypothetical protein J1F60_05215 [Oscillospiraceae bacterium]|nr:hypothetical protein [Oscillospiraceae bacterium]
MLHLLIIDNVNTGIGIDLLPILIAGGVVIAAIIFGVVLSVVSKKNKQKKKAQRKAQKNSNNKQS